MPLFNYESLSSTGRRNKGIIDASDIREAREKLREQGFTVTKILKSTKATKTTTLKNKDLLTITVQLSQMINAGVPLYDSLKILEEQYRCEAFSPIIVNICDQVKNGRSLSEALSLFPESFDTIYCSMVAAGESSGSLDTMLLRISSLLKKQNTIRSQTITAMIYPAVLALFTLAVVVVLMTFVVPTIEDIFDATRVNAYTRLVLSISHFLSGYWLLYIPIIAGITLSATLYLKSPAGKVWRDNAALKMPLIKTAVGQVAIARFSRTMATLQEGGVSIIESLRLARKTMKNSALEKVVEDAEEKIIAGSSLSKQLATSSIIPVMVSRMLAVGEDTGDTATMFSKIADIFEEDTEKTLTRITALAQPVILVTLGAIVGLVLLAVLIPFTDITALTP
mgnify:FL=1